MNYELKIKHLRAEEQKINAKVSKLMHRSGQIKRQIESLKTDAETPSLEAYQSRNSLNSVAIQTDNSVDDIDLSTCSLNRIGR